MKFVGETAYNHENTQKTGVLICNLGTPDSCKTKDVRKFLKQFLSDHRVIEVPKLLWWFILNFIILRLRPAKSAKLYKSIWTDEGSPLLVYSKKLLKKLQNSSDEQHVFALGMRYGNPSIEQALLELRKQNCNKIHVLPLFPQYSGTTTGSIFDEISRVLSKWRWVPSINFINSYHDNPGYIQAIAKSLSESIDHDRTHKIVFTYHGIPKRNFDQGDPYYCFCHKTTKLIADKLNLKPEQYITTFQSRFGKLEWLKPYTINVMQDLAHQGVRKATVIAPGFSVDCLETIEEIMQENKSVFLQSGGERLTYIPCLNDSEQHVSFIHNIIRYQDNI